MLFAVPRGGSQILEETFAEGNDEVGEGGGEAATLARTCAQVHFCFRFHGQ